MMAINLSLEKYPFSRSGSYFSFSIITGEWGELGKGLYLHTHHGGSTQAFKVDPVREQKVLEYEVQATATELTLKPSGGGGGEIAIVITDGGTVRFRGKGVGLRLEMPATRWRFAYELPGGAWGFNTARDNVQFALERLSGELYVDAPWIQGKGYCKESGRMMAEITPDETGTFEAAIDEFSTTWIKPERPSFETCREDVEQEYAAWEKGLPAVESEYEKTRDLAGYVNWSAIVDPVGNLSRRTMLMSKISMCHVFGWDHAFNAMAHSSHDPDLAWDQLMVMADKQDKYGKCPDNMNDSKIMYTFAKPPIQGWALRRMWDENPNLFTPERLTEAYEYLSKWSNWLCNHRTWPGELLPFYIHGFDSGWDNSTIFDVGVPLIAPDLAAYLIIQLEVLSDIAHALHKDTEADTWKRRSSEMLAALIDQLWKEDRFVGMLKPSGKLVDCESLITCMPIILGNRLPKEIQTHLVTHIREHLTPYGLATEKPDSSEYKDRGYWRGSIWAPSTMLAISGLEDIGQDELVKTIARGFCDMCQKSGFAENFDAKSGAGYFDPAYTWTSSVFMILASNYTDIGQ
jgi:putative isomerase